jgi:hypothetical protein
MSNNFQQCVGSIKHSQTSLVIPNAREKQTAFCRYAVFDQYCVVRYAGFVYCLGYGEKHLTNNQLYPKRDGTPQFWKTFFNCNNPASSLHDFRPNLGQTSPRQRLQNKIKLLNDLKIKRGLAYRRQHCSAL